MIGFNAENFHVLMFVKRKKPVWEYKLENKSLHVPDKEKDMYRLFPKDHVNQETCTICYQTIGIVAFTYVNEEKYIDKSEVTKTSHKVAGKAERSKLLRT